MTTLAIILVILNIYISDRECVLLSNQEEEIESNGIFKTLDTERNVAVLIQRSESRIRNPDSGSRGKSLDKNKTQKQGAITRIPRLS